MSRKLNRIRERLDWMAVAGGAFLVSAFGGMALAYSGCLR